MELLGLNYFGEEIPFLDIEGERQKVNTGPTTLFSAVSSSPCFSLDTSVCWMQSLAGSNHLAGVVIGRNTKETEAEE